MEKRIIWTGLIMAGALTLVIMTTGAGATEVGQTSFDFYGYIKGDLIYDFKRIRPEWNSTLRPTQIPIPREGSSYYEDGEIIFSVKSSRVGVDIEHPTKDKPIKGKLELDFYGTGSNAGQLLPRVRHAHVIYGDILIGQAWSLFSDPHNFPLQLDFWGPSGIPSSRRPQLRWTIASNEVRRFAVALEQPGAGLDAGKAAQVDPDFTAELQSKLPDFTAQYWLGGNWGYLQVGGVARELAYERTDTPGAEFSDSEYGWGAFLSGRFTTQGQSGVLFSVLYGSGVSNYLNDAGPDLTGDETGIKAQTIPVATWHLSYEAWWSSQWSSSFGASQVNQENTAFQEPDAFHIGSYAYFNLIRHPHENLMYGVEFLAGKLRENDGQENEDYRIQFSTKFTF